MSNQNKTPQNKGPGGGPLENMSFTKPKDSKSTLRKLLNSMREYKIGLVFVVIFAVLSVVLQTLGPYILGLATNEVADGIMRINAGTGGILLPVLIRLLILLAGAYIFSALLSYFQQFILVGITQKMMLTMRRDIDHKIRRLPLRYFDNNALGDILSRVTNDVDTVSTTLQQSLPQVFSAILTIIMVLVSMLLLSPLLTLIGLVTLPLSVIFSMLIVKRSSVYFKGQQKTLGDLNGHIEEMYSCHTLIKAYGTEDSAKKTFDVYNDELFGFAFKSQYLSGIIMPLAMFFSNLGYVLVAVIGCIGVAQGNFKVGTIQTFIQYLRQFSQPISQLATISNLLQSTLAAAERVFEFLEEEEESPDEVSATALPNRVGNVDISHVAFGYSADKILINDLSIAVKSGEQVAIVGPTGAGKTTLVNLLLRFYDVDKGQISIDGVGINHMRRDDLRAMFGMVLQDTWLFSGTIEENIRYGRLDATHEEVVAAAKAAYAHSFIITQPGGYQMQLGEDAGNISQGQRQLITIARAILSNPTILVLDEATSSVDTRTESLIQKAMARLMQNRTSFVIAHRLSTIRDASVILVMNDGDIVETGNHTQLLAKNGFYAKLYNSQFTGGK